MRHLRRLGHSLAAGALAGAALAPLQLILWPEIRPPFSRLLLVLLAWTSWSAIWLGFAAFLVVEITGIWRRRIASAPGWDARLVGALGFAFSLLVGLVAWWNRALTRDLLVPAARDALGTVAVLTGVLCLAMVIRRSRRWAAFPLSLLVIAGAWWAWSATPAPPRAAGDGASVLPDAPRRLLLVSWEGADLSWLLPAMDAGDMPFLAGRWKVGAWGQTRTMRPFSRPTALASMLTGCTPAVHGITGKRTFRLPWLSHHPVSLLLAGPWPTPHQLPWRQWERAATPPPRRAPLWEILLGAGVRVGMSGWPGMPAATWRLPMPLAAETLPFSALGADLRRSVMAAGAARPGTGETARAAFSIATEVGAATALRHARDPVEGLFVDLDLPLRLRPLFTRPEGGVADQDVLRHGARLLDEQLRGLWMMMGGEEVLLVVVSPYGLAPPSPMRRLKNLLGGRRQWPVSPIDSPDGFLLLAGPGVKSGTRLRASRLSDLAPTVLYLLDLPVARDMAGRVLLEAIDDEKAATSPLRLVASYPSGAGRPGSQR